MSMLLRRHQNKSVEKKPEPNPEKKASEAQKKTAAKAQ